MKPKIFLLAVFFVGMITSMKAQDLPKEGVALVIDKTSFSLAPGTTTEVEVKLLRSKRARKTKFDGLEARTSKGIAISFAQKTEVVDTYTMSILVEEDATPKSHTVVVKGSGVNGSKIKGKVISIEVTGSQMVKSDG